MESFDFPLVLTRPMSRTMPKNVHFVALLHYAQWPDSEKMPFVIDI